MAAIAPQASVEHFYPELNELYLSHSTREKLHGCERKFEFKHFFKQSLYGEGFAAEVGKALHVAFQHWFVTGNEDEATWLLMEHYPIHLAQTLQRNTRPLEACYATLKQLMGMVKFDEYELAQITCSDGVVRPAIEVPFRLNISGFSLSDTKHIPVWYRGQTDFILYHRMSNTYVVVDLKTTLDNMPDLSAKFTYAEQCLPYGIVLERILGRDLSEGFSVKYIVAYIDIAEPRVMVYTFEKSKRDIEDWAKGLLFDLNLLKFFANSGWFPRRSSSCIAYKQRCGYFGICQSRQHTAIQTLILNGGEAVADPYESEFEPWITLDMELVA